MKRRLSLRARRLYFLMVSVIFVVTVPVLVAFSLGYRLNAQGRITQTGGITIKNVPTGAKVFLRGKEVGTGSLLDKEVFVGGLIPGDYVVEVFKEGFFPWKKHLSVSAKKASVQTMIAIPKPLVFKHVLIAMPDDKTNSDGKPANSVTLSAAQAEEIAALFRHPPQNGTEHSFVFGSEATVLRRFGGLEIVQKKDQLLAGWAGVDDRMPPTFIDESGFPLRVFPMGHLAAPLERVDFFPDRFELA